MQLVLGIFQCSTLIMFDKSVDFVGFISDAGSGTIDNGPLASPGCTSIGDAGSGTIENGPLASPGVLV